MNDKTLGEIPWDVLNGERPTCNLVNINPLGYWRIGSIPIL